MTGTVTNALGRIPLLDTARHASWWASTGIPLTPPAPEEPEPDDEGNDGTDDVPPTPPSEPPPVPMQDPPAEPGGNRPHIMQGVSA